MLDEREKAVAQDLEDNKKVIREIQAQEEMAAKAMNKRKAENREIRDQVTRDLEEAAKRMKDEQAAEMARKEELIRQIRELEKIPIQRSQGFDPTEAGSHGLLVEMSVAELRERLELNRAKLQQEIEFKRDTNLARKEREAQDLLESAAKVEEARKKRKQFADERRERERQDAEIRERARITAREKGLKDAYSVISNKKRLKAEEDARLAKELKEIKLQRQYMNANAAMVEFKQWEGLEKGKERVVDAAQNVKLMEQCGQNEIAVRDQLVRATNAKNDVLAKITYDRGYAERLSTRKKDNEVLHKKTLEYKQGMHAKQRQFEDDLRETQHKRNPFKQKINEMSLTQAKAMRQQHPRGDTFVGIDAHGQFDEDEFDDDSRSGGFLAADN